MDHSWVAIIWSEKCDKQSNGIFFFLARQILANFVIQKNIFIVVEKKKFVKLKTEPEYTVNISDV